MYPIYPDSSLVSQDFLSLAIVGGIIGSVVSVLAHLVMKTKLGLIGDLVVGGIGGAIGSVLFEVVGVSMGMPDAFGLCATPFSALVPLAFLRMVARQSPSTATTATVAPRQPIAAPGQTPARQSAPPRTAYTPGLFLSYRRSDSAAETGRIYDRLVGHYGKEAIFKDVDSIPYGVDFRTYLYDMVSRCGALIAVIGPEWLSAINESGLRRIDDPTDFVRIEIAAALGRRMPVVPLLVRGAVLPREIDLPIDLKPLVYQNAAQARNDPDFHTDMDRLIKSLERTFGRE
jgi:uncharacterized membrane protein YeaQ/YmgE (transglycosylase-associated protein family)